MDLCDLFLRHVFSDGMEIQMQCSVSRQSDRVYASG